MEQLFKILGLLMILAAASCCGFWSAYQLQKRAKNLRALHRSLACLRDRIRLNEGEMERLLLLSFGNRVKIISAGKYAINADWLEREERELFNSLFYEIGMSDAQAECERIGYYMNLLDVKCGEAEQKYRELGKLYRSLGVLCGIFLCIFFL